MKKRVMALMLALCMAAGVLGGCGTEPAAKSDAGKTASGAAAPETSATGVDLSKKVELNVYTMGGSNPKDMDMVNQAASKLLEEKLNCTVNVQVMADWANRYKLVLSSGEPVDLIWTAMWYSYQPYAYDGAWLDITEMVDKVAPELREIIGQDVWDMSKIGGKDYAIPTNHPSWSQWGVSWREDLRKKYNCPEIKDWESMEAYAEAILANEPGMIPFCDSPSGGLWHSYSEKNKMYVGLGQPQFSYGMGVSLENSRELEIFSESDEFMEYAKTARKWVEKGYTQPDVASSTDTGNAGMLSGKYAGSINSQGVATTLTGLIVPAREAYPDWEIGYMNFGEMFECSYRAHPTFMAFALPKSCPNPERALLFAKEMMTNDELFNLYDCGIEGTHYKVENGNYVSMNDPVNPGYLQGGAGITNYLFNEKAKLYSEDYQWVLNYEKEHMEPYEVTNYFEGFPEDYSAYSDKVTAISEISTQYMWPVIRGSMPDVEAAVADVNKRMAEAGRQEVYDEVVKQYNAYLDGLGVK